MISNKTKLLLCKSLNCDVNSVSEELNIRNTPQWDSLAHLRLVCGIEEELGRNLSAMEVLNIESAIDVESLIVRE